eukprot:3604192-Pyramimonas_sp.AAC.1
MEGTRQAVTFMTGWTELCQWCGVVRAVDGCGVRRDCCFCAGGCTHLPKLDAKGYSVDAKGYRMGVKGYSVYAKGSSVGRRRLHALPEAGC